MSASRARVGVSADAFVAVVRAYADRVHDDVRRLGCTPAEAAEVVETSALNLAERLRVRPHEVPDLVGTWFRDARLFAERVASGGADPDEVVESSEGIVQTSEEDAASRRALAELNERDRVALLLRDAYDLPYASTAVALGCEVAAAGTCVAKARLRFLALAGGASYDEPVGHDELLSATARLADGSLPPDEAGGAERHAAKCAVCGPLVAPLREARKLLTGLAILAMPDPDRDALIARATAVAERVLPTAAEVAAAAEDTGPSRLVPLSVAAGCVVGAVALGVFVAFATTGGGGDPTAVPTFDVESPTPTPSASASVTPTPTPTTASPTPTATAMPTPTLTPTPTATASPTASATFVTGNERIAISPNAGPNGTTVRVTGSGWRPGSTVSLSYIGPLGDTDQRGSVTVREDGTFSGTIVAYDPERIPGFHTVRARGGSRTVDATYTATS
ncbi:MAG TPA: sigma factor-like helix-turn-helix DNA-binding protein [Frankiaceae bacterium]|jgi:DNA-directed RNA polymerase specialized sigma24 family protein|nr:sigma factor-like helix-turn-helix DNA-binding protein [Frankiaceae bacterium]